MWMTSLSVPASPHSSRDVKRTEYSGAATDPPPCAGVARRMPCADPDLVADRVARLRARGEVLGQHAAVTAGTRKAPSGAALEFLFRRKTRFGRPRGGAGQPAFVIRRRKVLFRRHAFHRMTEAPTGDVLRSDPTDHQAEGAPLPIFGEPRLGRLVLDGAEAV